MRDLIITYIRLSILIVKLKIDEMCCRNKACASDCEKEGERKKGEKRNSICVRDLKRVTIIIRDPNNFGRRTPLGIEIIKQFNVFIIIILQKLKSN